MRNWVAVGAVCISGCQQETLMAPDPPAMRMAHGSMTVVAPSAPSTLPGPSADASGKRLGRVERAGRQQHAGALRTAQKALSGARIREVHGKDFDVVLDETARRGLPKVKDAVIGLAKHILDEAGAQALRASDEDLSVTLREGFSEAGFTIAPVQGIGGLVAISAMHPVGHPQRLAVSFSVEFGRGGDDVLCVFEKVGADLRAVLVRRIDGYDSISGARWASVWAIAPPAADGSWFVVDAHSHAWISSLWRGISYAIVEPGTDANQPKLSLKGSDDAYLGEDEIASVTATATTATIGYGSWDRLGGEHTRSYRRSFTRDASGSFTRSAPFVYSPRELIHELLEGDEALARLMALPGAGDKVAALHKKLRSAKDTATGTFSFKDQPDVEVQDLKSPVTVVFDCAGCTQWPKHIELVAEQSGGSWMIRSVSHR